MKNITLLILASVLLAIIIAAWFYAYKQFYAPESALPLELETETQIMELLGDDGNLLEAPDKGRQTFSPIGGEADFLPEGFLE